MKKVYIALITPFLDNGEIDFYNLDLIMNDLILIGIHGFIVNGTTAESPTLSEAEKFALLEHVINYTKGSVEIYFGCGNNNTLDTLRMCRKAANYTIDGLLLVTPYYNKPSQEGLYQHYLTIAKNVNLPIILYQVEGRCNIVFDINTLEHLMNECSNIKALKYASKNMEKAKEIRKKLPLLKLYCGDDSMLKECYDLDFDGIISVVGHIASKELLLFYQKQDLEIDFFIKRISYLLFLESNPAGIKYVLSKYYPMSERLRLPLVTYSNKNKKLVDAYFDTYRQENSIKYKYESKSHR